ncbi:rCG63554 [Rattus norvegicus]|uniref:RCG63554 n=1 Tax=Rattus norvegicus TaxID=10116 RepID=A6JBU3_RAT|nr:rCG63554 [Rattus norvegicus]
MKTRVCRNRGHTSLEVWPLPVHCLD